MNLNSKILVSIFSMEGDSHRWRFLLLNSGVNTSMGICSSSFICYITHRLYKTVEVTILFFLEFFLKAHYAYIFKNSVFIIDTSQVQGKLSLNINTTLFISVTKWWIPNTVITRAQVQLLLLLSFIIALLYLSFRFLLSLFSFPQNVGTESGWLEICELSAT